MSREKPNLEEITLELEAAYRLLRESLELDVASPNGDDFQNVVRAFVGSRLNLSPFPLVYEDELPEWFDVCAHFDRSVVIDGVRMYPRELVERRPQRFRFRDSKTSNWRFGVCTPVENGRWFAEVLLSKGFGSFDDEPWEVLGQILGAIEAFEWIDNDFGWAEFKPQEKPS